MRERDALTSASEARWIKTKPTNQVLTYHKTSCFPFHPADNPKCCSPPVSRPLLSQPNEIRGNAAAASVPDRFFLAEAWWVSAWRGHHDSSSIHSDPPGPLLNQVRGATVVHTPEIVLDCCRCLCFLSSRHYRTGRLYALPTRRLLFLCMRMWKNCRGYSSLPPPPNTSFGNCNFQHMGSPQQYAV